MAEAEKLRSLEVKSMKTLIFTSSHLLNFLTSVLIEGRFEDRELLVEFQEAWSYY
jgi:hypothetical protein